MVENKQSKGGKARAENLSPDRRKQIASVAAKKRWAPGNFAPDAPPAPVFAKHAGSLDLGGSDLDVYVLSNDFRVISLNKVVKAITDKEGGQPRRIYRCFSPKRLHRQRVSPRRKLRVRYTRNAVPRTRHHSGKLSVGMPRLCRSPSKGRAHD